jgi:hypothetical protein
MDALDTLSAGADGDEWTGQGLADINLLIGDG